MTTTWRRRFESMRPLLIPIVFATLSCSKPPPVARIAACPEGAHLSGDAPPDGLRQRCEKTQGVRHGASREWWENRQERAYTEWWDGRKHGQFTLWFQDGKVRSQGAHLHGVPAGEWIYYKE